MALDFLKEKTDDEYVYLDDLYGSKYENMSDINDHFLGR